MIFLQHKFSTMDGKILLLAYSFALLASPLWGQFYSNEPEEAKTGKKYFVFLDDARLDVGIKVVSVFALDDRAPLSSNPHFQAMWSLIKLGASLEALLQGMEEPINDINLSKEFGQNGYNRTVFTFFVQYGFGESSDVKIPRHFVELAISPGYFREGQKGMNLHVDYRANIAKTHYGAGSGSIDRAFDYEVFLGLRTGFDWSFRRSESEAGFFSHLTDEIQRIALENELTATQLITLESLAEDSRILLPEDVGGRALHLGPIAGVQFSKKFGGDFRVFVNGLGFYDLMDLFSNRGDEENTRSQHQANIGLGLTYTLGANGSSKIF